MHAISFLMKKNIESSMHIFSKIAITSHLKCSMASLVLSCRQSSTRRFHIVY